jgi:hypothetical protein
MATEHLVYDLNGRFHRRCARFVNWQYFNEAQPKDEIITQITLEKLTSHLSNQNEDRNEIY